MRHLVAAMMRANAKKLESRWSERLDGSSWAPRLGNGRTSRALIAALLKHYGEAIDRDYWRAVRTPDEGTDGSISGTYNPRVESAYRIGVLSIGREVIEAYLNEEAFIRLNVDGPRRNEILDDLDAAFRLLALHHIQHVCQWSIHATRAGAPSGPAESTSPLSDKPLRNPKISDPIFVLRALRLRSLMEVSPHMASGSQRACERKVGFTNPGVRCLTVTVDGSAKRPNRQR